MPYLDRVRTDNFSIEALRQLQCKPTLSGASGTGYHYHLLLVLLLSARNGARGTEQSAASNKEERRWSEKRHLRRVKTPERTHSPTHLLFGGEGAENRQTPSNRFILYFIYFYFLCRKNITGSKCMNLI